MNESMIYAVQQFILFKGYRATIGWNLCILCNNSRGNAD